MIAATGQHRAVH